MKPATPWTTRLHVALFALLVVTTLHLYFAARSEHRDRAAPLSGAREAASQAILESRVCGQPAIDGCASYSFWQCMTRVCCASCLEPEQPRARRDGLELWCLLAEACRPAPLAILRTLQICCSALFANVKTWLDSEPWRWLVMPRSAAWPSLPHVLAFMMTREAWRL